MARLVVFSLVLLLAVYGLVDGVRECYKCSGEGCLLLDTTIQNPCPHIDNICYTVVHPDTCKVFEKGCGIQSQCEVYSNCQTCDKDRCNSEEDFTCETEPCKN